MHLSEWIEILNCVQCENLANYIKKSGRDMTSYGYSSFFSPIATIFIQWIHIQISLGSWEMMNSIKHDCLLTKADLHTVTAENSTR